MNENKKRNNLENYVRGIRAREADPYYGFELINAVNKMDTDTLYKFCTYVDSMERKYNEKYSSVRSVARIGELFALGFDGSQIDETKYLPQAQFYDVVRNYMKDIEYCKQTGTLPPKQNIQYQQPQYQQPTQEQVNQQYINRMNQIIRQYRLEQDRVFYDHCSFEDGNIPAQGWKLHVTADSLEKYCEMMEVMIPELIANNVQFKVVAPEQFQTAPGRNIYGKEFTIYPTESFDISKFSQRFINLLNETPTRCSQSDQYFGCRVTARFGGFTKYDVMDKNGFRTRDSRDPGTFSPDWVDKTSLMDILNFHKEIKDKVYRTGDYKLYLQEYMQGVQSKPGEQYLFDEYVFDDIRQAQLLNQQTAKEGSLFNMFGKYIVVAPIDQRERLQNFCATHQFNPASITTTNSLGTLENIESLIKSYTNYDYQNYNQNQQQLYQGAR